MHPMAFSRTIRMSLSARAWALVSMLVIPAAILGCQKDPAPAGNTGDAAAGADKDGSTSDSSIKIDISFGGVGDTSPPGSNDSGAKPPDNCANLRNCVTSCKHDSACEQRCVAAAPAAVRTEYATVTTCSAKTCTSDDELCRCPIECNGGGECTDLVDACRGFELDDFFCDQNCR